MKIRSSALPAHADCPRRSVAKTARKAVTDAGHELRQILPSVGAAVGTATHAAVERLLRAKQEGQEANVKDAVDEAAAGFDAEVCDGAEWDDTTPSAGDAHRQIRRLTGTYAEQVLPQVEPLLIEAELQADLGGG